VLSHTVNTCVPSVIAPSHSLTPHPTANLDGVCVALYPGRAILLPRSKHIIANRCVRVPLQIDRFVSRQVVLPLIAEVRFKADDATPGGNDNVQFSI
jgi:hypothetical protein